MHRQNIASLDANELIDIQRECMVLANNMQETSSVSSQPVIATSGVRYTRITITSMAVSSELGDSLPCARRTPTLSRKAADTMI